MVRACSVLWSVLWLMASLAAAQPIPVEDTLEVDFDDGFESGLGNWTRVTDGNPVLQAESDLVWDGQRALVAKLGGLGRFAYVERSVEAAAGGALFVRAWLYLPQTLLTGLGAGHGVRVLEARGQTDVLALELVGVDEKRARLRATVAGMELTSGGPVMISGDTWHRVELGYDVLNQQAVLYLDDARLPRSSLPMSVSLPPVSHLRVGLVKLEDEVTQAAIYLDNLALVSAGPVGTTRSVNQLSWEFDSGLVRIVDDPPGKAAHRFLQGGQQLGPDPGASRYGARGLAVVDTDGASPGQGASAIGYFSGGADTVYMRFWLRQAEVSTPGANPVAQLGSLDDLGTDSPAVLLSRSASGDLTASVRHGDGSVAGDGTESIVQGAWHLVEVVARGMGTGAGAVQTYVDNIRFGDFSNLAWEGFDLQTWALGGVAEDPAYTGVLHLDELRLARAAQPNRFKFTEPVLFERGICRPLTVEALTAEETPARTPAPARPTLSGGGVEFYSDPACLGPQQTTFNFPAGAQRMNLFGTVPGSTFGGTLDISAPDYLPTSVPAEVDTPGTLPELTGLQVNPNPAGAGPVTVTWATATSADTDHYTITLYHDGSPSPPVETTDTSYSFDPLPGLTQIGVRVYNLGGEFSPEVLISLLTDESPPPTPAAPTVSFHPATQRAAVSWQPVVDVQTHTASYTLKLVTPESTVTVADLTATSYAFDVLTSGSYAFSVVATDAVGNSSAFSPQTVVTLPPAGALAPRITTVPNTVAVLGRPYRVSVSGRMEAQSQSPVTWSACPDGLPFPVDSDTGAISWTPETTGTVDLCVRATNAADFSELEWTVTVRATPAAVEARLSVSPGQATAPATITLDASASETGGAVLAYQWWFGDGTRLQTATPVVEHTYALPGGYLPRVTVIDVEGTEATAEEELRIASPDGRSPPLAKIVPSSVRASGQAQVTFSCECSGTITGMTWDIGDGEPTFGQTREATFGPGRHWVRLVVINDEGLTATDVAEVVVTAANGAEPPDCAPSVHPASGPAPLGVTHLANASPALSPVASIVWDAEGTLLSGERVEHTYTKPGWSIAAVVVTAEDGLKCHGSIPIAVTAAAGDVPPAIPDSWVERALTCGQPFRHQPTAVLPAEYTWALQGAPEGMEIDPLSGEISWTPTPSHRTLDGGALEVLVSLSSGEAAAHQYLSLSVDCGTAELTTTCGCGATGPEAPLLWGLLLLFARRTIRRATTRRHDTADAR